MPFRAGLTDAAGPIYLGIHYSSKASVSINLSWPAAAPGREVVARPRWAEGPKDGPEWVSQNLRASSSRARAAASENVVCSDYQRRGLSFSETVDVQLREREA